MKKIFFLFIVAAAFSSCHFIGKPIKGNGNLRAESRNISFAQKIKLAGSYDVELLQGGTFLKVEADENLLPYIETYNEDDWLIIKTKEDYHISSANKITITVTTDKLEAVKLTGSGNITGKAKFTGSNYLEVSIAGSGSANLKVNAPKVKSSIAGNGDIILSGETRDEEIRIAGYGNCKAEGLKSENAVVHIAGSGDAKVDVTNKLEIHIAGSGNVFYKGNPTVEQHIAGSGNIKKLEN
jgi:hypothetical protein